MRKKAEKLGGIITFDFEEGEGFEIRSSLPESLKIKGEKNENYKMHVLHGRINR